MARTTKPPSEVRLNLAVEMRRRGSTWEAVGQRLGCAAETVRRWPASYPERWQEAVRRDCERVAGKGDGDLAQALNRMLLDSRPMVRFRAAKALIDLKLSRERQNLRTRLEVASQGGTVRLVLSLVRECSHVELQLVAKACLELANRKAESLPPVRTLFA